MQKLEDTFKEADGEGPGLDVGQRLAMWPLKCATWSRTVYKTAEDSQAASQSQPQQRGIDYMLVYFTVRCHQAPCPPVGLEQVSDCRKGQCCADGDADSGDCYMHSQTGSCR